MIESVMRQGMDTWLRKECVDELSSYVNLTRRLKDLEYIWQFNPENIRAVINVKQAIDTIIFYMEHSGLSNAVKITTKARLNNISSRSDDKEYNVSQELNELYKELFVKATEGVVECQCGKPEETKGRLLESTGENWIIEHITHDYVLWKGNAPGSEEWLYHVTNPRFLGTPVYGFTSKEVAFRDAIYKHTIPEITPIPG